MKNKFKFLMGIKIIAGITFFVLLFGFGTMHLWNWLVPTLFHGPVITFAQAIGLLVLSKILLGGFGRKFGGPHRHPQWKEKMKERFSSMTPEEKEKFKQRFKDKCRSRFWMDDESKAQETTELKDNQSI